MILDTLDRIDLYAPLHSGFTTAAAWLKQADLAALDVGQVQLDGDKVYALIQRVSGRGREASPLETHQNYIDLQLCVEGADCIGWSPVRTLAGKGQGYQKNKDVEFYEGAPHVWIEIPPGVFAIFFPEDAHAPLGTTGALKKAVIKIRA